MSDNGSRSADDRRATGHRGKKPCSCMTTPARLSDSNSHASPTPVSCFSLVLMRDKCRCRDTCSNCDQRNADAMCEMSPALQLLNRHNRGKTGPPGHIHHPDCKHHQHHRPAAAKTVKHLLYPEAEPAAGHGCPSCEKERELSRASNQSSVCERREWIDALTHEHGSIHKPARRSHADH